LTHFGHFFMTKPRVSLRSENCPIWIGIGVRLFSESVSAFVGIRSVPEYLTTQFIYDHENRLTHTIHADGSTNQTVYNAFGKESVGIDALGRQTRFDYDDSGRLVRTVYPDGTSEGVAYDAEGHKVAVTNQLA
jgi:YD repeat-containing protein